MSKPRRLVEVFLLLLVKWLIRGDSSSGHGRRKDGAAEGLVVLTGTFYSDNWLLTHIEPLLQSKRISAVVMVSTSKVPDRPGLHAIYPSSRLRRILGGTTARLVTFYRVVRERRPEFIGGFHLLINGLVALRAATVFGGSTLYFCGGGAREVAGGGYATENRLFNRLQGHSRRVEEQLIRAVDRFDLTVVMGSSAKAYFQKHGITSRIVIHPGGIDSDTFRPTDTNKSFDMMFLGRISDIKRVDRFLDVLAAVRKKVPNATAVLVGDGPLRVEMTRYAESLGLADATTFVGWSDDVASWLNRSKVFVLTSESEGLSQALIQAGLCGLPAIVTDVGDLSDLIDDGRNGHIIDPQRCQDMVPLVCNLITDTNVFSKMSKNALALAAEYTVASAARRWDSLL